MGLFDKFGKKNKTDQVKQTEPVKNASVEKPTSFNMYTMVIQDIFSIKTAGCVVVGLVYGGTMRVGDKAYVISREGKMLSTQIGSIENPSQGKMTEAGPGSNVGILLNGLESGQLQKGDVISNFMAQKQVDVNQPVVNPRLKGLLAEMKVNKNEDLTNLLFEEIATQAHFLSIIFLTKEPVSNGNGTATFQKDSVLQLPILSTQDKLNFYPAFTDWSEVRKWQGCPSDKTMIMDFDSYASMILKDPNIEGFVIDPFGVNFTVDRKLVNHLKTRKEIIKTGVSEQKVEKDTTVRLGEPKVYPTEMVEAIKAYLKQTPAVKRAWLRLMYKDNEYSYLLIIDFEGDKKEIFGGIAGAARPYLKDMYIDMVPYQDNFGKNAVKGVEPFFA